MGLRRRVCKSHLGKNKQAPLRYAANVIRCGGLLDAMLDRLMRRHMRVLIDRALFHAMKYSRDRAPNPSRFIDTIR